MVSPRIGFTAIVLLLGAAVANAQIPAEPQVTLGADLKVLRFDWEPIPGATFYRLWVNAAGKGFRTVGDRMAASVTHAEVSIAAHLHDWRRTRYVVTACNAAGCNGLPRSIRGDQRRRPDAQGELDPALNPEGPEYRTHTYLRSGDAWQRFATLAPFCRGDQCLITRMSGDGQTLVSYCVTSPTEVRLVTMKRAANTWVHVSDLPIDFVVPQDAMALNPDGTVMALAEFGVTNTVGVYHWIGGNWVRVQGFLPPADSDTFGFELALSNDARLVVVGDFEARQLGAGVTVFPMSGTEEQGAVYIFVHTAGGSWELRNVVKSPNPGLNDQFGISISMSATGRTLAVGASGEDSSATGIDGNRTHEDAPEAGAAYLY